MTADHTFAMLFADAQLAILPAPEAIRDTAKEVTARPEFQVDAPSTLPFDIMAMIIRILEAIFSPFQRFAKYVFDISPLLGWLLVVGMVLIAAALIMHIIYSFRAALAKRAEVYAGLSKSRKFVDPAKLVAEATAVASRGDFIGGVRLLFRACLIRLEAAEERALRLGMTNRELLRRYQSVALKDALRTFVETIDAKWYGHAQCDVGDYENCVQAERIVSRYSAEIAAKNAAAKNAERKV